MKITRPDAGAAPEQRLRDRHLSDHVHVELTMKSADVERLDHPADRDAGVIDEHQGDRRPPRPPHAQRRAW